MKDKEKKCKVAILPVAAFLKKYLWSIKIQVICGVPIFDINLSKYTIKILVWPRHRGLQEIWKVYPDQIIINRFHEFIRNISIKLLSKNEKMSKKKNSVKMNHFDHKFLAWTFQNFLLCNKKWFIFLTLKWNFENHITK